MKCIAQIKFYKSYFNGKLNKTFSNNLEDSLFVNVEMSGLLSWIGAIQKCHHSYVQAQSQLKTNNTDPRRGVP